MESGTKLTDFFVMTFEISSLFSKLTKRRSPAADHMSWVLCHVICWRQHWSRNERILSPCRNNADIYWGNAKWKPMNCFFCDDIWDFFYIFQIDKAEKWCCRVIELSPSHVICWRQHWSRNWMYFVYSRKDPLI